MEIHALIAELDQLQLPTDQYAITSSGVLAIRSLRSAHDLDIIVTSDLWVKLSRTYPITQTKDFQSINIGNIQILGTGSYFTNNDSYPVDAQIQSADLIQGKKFVSLAIVRDIKLTRNKTKDIIDIQIIDDYLANNSTPK